jgi:predicted acylesterase/phospholipase RssA
LEDRTAQPWRDPPLSCDIVMKGGITSGVVYPGAVVKLAKRYRFRSIGGASAGALAAVAAAAAEHGRESGGFARLAEVPQELASTVDGAPFILTMFQPEPSTRSLFRAALAFQRFGALRGIAATILSFWRFPLLAAALAVLAIVLGVLGAIPWWLAVALVAVAPWILVVGVIRDALAAFKEVARNDFGLCRLGPESGSDSVLTVWLHRLIQHLSGRAQSRETADGTTPLTFADLWGVPALLGDESEAELKERQALIDRLGWNASEREVDLQVITTNLSFGRPMRIPTVRDRWRATSEDGGLLFDPEEWKQFFPQEVVQHMKEHAAEPEAEEAALIEAQSPGRRLLYFPGGAHLPIVVAARMSLSFPVLISTVPLWQIKYREDGAHRLTRLAFSDGGISSNFPVHFFDAPLPTRPTFALNLAGFERDENPDLDDPSQAVEDPVGVNEQARDIWKEPRSMTEFAIAIKDAMQNWRDNSQARMPGFRERVIHVKLARGEGGLNLAMDDQKVKRLIDRGDYAGRRLIDLFSGSEDGALQRRPHWNDHRYARFRILMSALERLFQGFQRGYAAEPDAVTEPYDERVAAGLVPPYPLTQARLAAATLKTEQYRALADVEETLDDDDVPRPRAVSRLMPPL